MSMGPGVRKLVRTVYIVCTVGWLGAVAGFLALAVAGVSSQDAQMASSAYLGMAIITRYVIVPLSLVKKTLLPDRYLRTSLFDHNIRKPALHTPTTAFPTLARPLGT